MKRNIILLIAMVLIGLIVFYVYKNKGDQSTTIDRAESNFKIENINTIGRIILTQKDGTRSDLKRVGDHWVINDQHRVRQTNIDHLLRGIQTQHLDHIPNRAATENILPSMAVTGIHVEIFDLNGASLLNYYVGGVTQDERGTYFLKEGSSQPYCLNQPGFDGGMRARYALTPVDWRDVRFWMEDMDKVDTMKVRYPKQIQHSFVIYKKGSGYAVDPMYTTTPRKEGEVTNRVKSYFTTLSQLACEDYMNDAQEKDSILQMVPFMEMTMIYPDKTSSLKFYPVGPISVSEFSPPVSRYFIQYEGKDFMIGQHEVMKGAFRSYDYFFGT
ncbi:MAG: hypothetical protein IPL92_06310 [Saprospiraceae bacterium]|nr:hypothetical protein [Candidatus Opimibacter iunctus]